MRCYSVVKTIQFINELFEKLFLDYCSKSLISKKRTWIVYVVKFSVIMDTI